MQLIAVKSRNAAATQGAGMVFYPLFLTPNSVPRDQLTRPTEVAATFNPVTYVMEAIDQSPATTVSAGTAESTPTCTPSIARRQLRERRVSNANVASVSAAPTPNATCKLIKSPNAPTNNRPQP